MSLGVILYGPPAAGKDTVTTELIVRNPRYRQFRRLKLGEGRTAGYRMSTPQEIAELRASDDIVWENHRYGAAYYVDRSFLARELSHAWPILHLGQTLAVSAIRRAFPDTEWLVVYLWCPREVAERRVIERGTGGVGERMAAWDATERLSEALFLDTANVSATDAAAHIDLAASRLQASSRT